MWLAWHDSWKWGKCVVAVCRSVLHVVSVLLQCIAVCCSVLQCVVVTLLSDIYRHTLTCTWQVTKQATATHHAARQLHFATHTYTKHHTCDVTHWRISWSIRDVTNSWIPWSIRDVCNRVRDCNTYTYVTHIHMWNAMHVTWLIDMCAIYSDVCNRVGDCNTVLQSHIYMWNAMTH